MSDGEGGFRWSDRGNYAMRRLNQLFQRFIAGKELCRKRGGALRAGDGRLLGYVDLIQVVGNRIVVQGWTASDNVKLSVGSNRSEVTPSIQRSDLSDKVASNGRLALGFALAVPYQDAPLVLELEDRNIVYCFERPNFASKFVRRARFLQLPAFLGRLLSTAPSIGIWYFSRSARRLAEIKIAFGEFQETLQSELRFSSEPSTLNLSAPVTIVLPVFNAFVLLQEALQRIEAHTDCPWHLILVEDCSTDPRVKPFLRSWSEANNEDNLERVTLLENSKNLGFIGSVNRALELARARGDHVVLLNSDALLPKDWATRLLEPILRDADVASVTPMSNNAEIFSVPIICCRDDLLPGQADQIDAVARSLPLGSVGSDAPTGVGFCMAMNKKFLAEVPSFDETFGRGYGEEVDWCQKTRWLGGRHLVQPRLFVEHRGGASFGEENKRALVAKNNARISERYPTYASDVQDYIVKDPIRTARLALGLAQVAQTDGCAIPLFLAHSWGGGAELYLRQRIRSEVDELGAAIVLRVGGQQRWQLELHTEFGITKGGCSEIATIELLLAPVENMRLIYSCGVGDIRPIEIPHLLLRLARGRSIEVLFHDYFPLCPSYHLLDSKGDIFGDLDVASSDSSRLLRARLAEGEQEHSNWRVAWDELLRRADRLVAFSHSSAQILEIALPDLASKISVRPHKLLQPVSKVDIAAHSGMTIGILGNIGAHKGADVVTSLAEKCSAGGNWRVALLGSLDPAFACPKDLTVHGEYVLSDLHRLVRRYDIGCWVIPSVWPETFSYTTHEALASGLPVFVFDVGAQAEAARKSVNGHVVRFGDPSARADDLLDAIYEVKNPKGRAVA
jgi:GT2 family glycosyltransferase/glycosyltransferase involved in cell wall biosynthesis